MKRYAITVLVILTTSIHAADWPEWRGPNRDGISTETGLLKAWPEDGPKLVWRIDKIGGGYSTPSVVGDRLYVLGSEGRNDEFVRALNTEDGSVVWSTRIGKVGLPDQKPPYPGSRSTPTVEGDRLYVFGSDGDIACLERGNGKIVWHRNVQTDFGGKPGRWAYAESPLIDGDRVVITPGGKDAVMAALEKATGKTIWTTSIPEAEEASFSGVAISHASGRKQYVQFLRHGLMGVDEETGELLWRYRRTAEGSPSNIPTPTRHGDYIYNATKRGGGALLKIDLEGYPIVTEVYHGTKLPTHLGGSVLLEGHLYGTTASAVVCTEFTTGALKWTDRSVGAASVFYADGMLYLNGEEGEIALVEATTEAYRERGRFTPPGMPEAKGKLWTYPVVANGKLYLRFADVVWCYDVGG